MELFNQMIDTLIISERRGRVAEKWKLPPEDCKRLAAQFPDYMSEAGGGFCFKGVPVEFCRSGENIGLIDRPFDPKRDLSFV